MGALTSFMLAALALAAPAASAVAPMAEDVTATTSDGNAVAVALHGTDDFDAILEFWRVLHQGVTP